MAKEYIATPEKYRHRLWDASHKEAEEYYESIGKKKRSWKEILKIADDYFKKYPAVKVKRASPLFLRNLPTSDAGVFEENGHIVIMISPVMRYYSDAKIKHILKHELNHIEKGEYGEAHYEKTRHKYDWWDDRYYTTKKRNNKVKGKR